MKLLLDTHVFLWYISGSARLAKPLLESIRDPQNEVCLSVVSIWEATVKHQLGKLPLPQSAATYLPRQSGRHQIASLSLDEPSVIRLGNLPPLHRDPFDQMLVCQAQEHDLILATVDAAIQAYPVAFIDVSRG
jgi:PIN domain nuclease of toxin-antitoxin system